MYTRVMTDSIFTRIIKREIPAEIVYEDDICIVIMNIKANNPGHVMVVPKKQLTDWLVLDQPTLNHLTEVAQSIAKLQKVIYQPKRVELAIVGLEVDHVHLHVFPIYEIADADHSAAQVVSASDLKTEAEKIRSAIKTQGGIK